MTADDVVIRREGAADRDGIRAVNEAAFGRPAEADLVERLRQEGAVLGSFVAEHDGHVVGHLLFSRTVIEAGAESVLSVALAPVAVIPAFQRRGIGTRLIQSGLEWLQTRGERVVLVLGDPEYYRRFGFSRERAGALRTPFPADAFMVLELIPEALDAIRGTVRYPAAFEVPGEGA